MWSNRKNREAAERFAARQEREDSAPRLVTEVPSLDTLALRIRHESGGRPVAEPGYVRHIVVATAPALFFIPCGNPNCVDGGHDITAFVMHALRSGVAEFEGEDACRGYVGSHDCGRVLQFSASASYR